MGRRSTRRRKRSSSSSTGGQGLTQVTITAFFLFTIILVASLFITQWDMANRLAMQQQVVVDTRAQQAAEVIGKSMAPYQDLMARLATNPDIATLVQSQDKEALQAKQNELSKLFPSAMAVRLISASQAAVDRSVTPHLSYACLDLLRSAEKSGKAANVEVHAHGTEQQHVDMIQPVIAANTVVGHIQVVLDEALLERWLNKAVQDNYLELVQTTGKKPVVISSLGDSSLQAGSKASVNIEGTSWMLEVWVPAAVSISMFNLTMLIVLVVAVLLVFIIVFMLKRSVSNAISADLENFMQLAVQVIRGQRAHDYPIKMSEFKSAMVRLYNMPSSNSMERERDHDPGSISMGGNSGVDPMATTESSMSFQELDNDLDDLDDAGGDEPVKKPEANPFLAAQGSGQATPASSGTIAPEIFKAYDIRGIVGKTLTSESIELIGRAIGSEAASRGLKVVAFGRDGRLSGPELGKALVKGLVASGINVIDVGMVPTPTLYYAAAEHAEGSGLMLTGSHNPPDYNGIKMVLGGETLSGDTIQQLRERIENTDFASGQGEYNKLDVKEQYIQRITSDIKIKRKLKVVIDCGNGVAGAIAPTLFKQLGCETIEMFCDVDGNFPNHHPDPSQPENLSDIISAVKQNNADLGLAFDGDGDRVGVISGDGSVIWPDRLMMLFAADVLKRNPGAQIIFDIKCSSNLIKYIWEKGGEPLMWKTGHSLIKAKMKQTGALLAGEMSGHIFFKERWYGFDDALYSAARLLEILSADARAPKEVMAALPDMINTPELKINMKEGEHHKFMEDLLAKADFGSANVSMIDGVRADYADGWGLVRASNTTPCLVLRFEGQTDEAIKKVQSRFRKALLDLKPDLKLPF